MTIRRLSRDTREYSEIGSTNEEMNRLLGEENLEEGHVIRAEFQLSGKGHQGNTWQAEPEMNLLFSLLLKPDTLKAESAFHLSRIVSLSLVEVLDKQEIKASIKWPNDILIGSSKICGILIENSLIGDKLSSSIIGIGLNVNQEVFDSAIPDPTSMFLEKGCHFDIKNLLEEFRAALESWYQSLLTGNEQYIMKSYLERLYRVDTLASYKEGNRHFKARIKGVPPTGELELLEEDGTLRRFGFKEVEYLR